MFTSSHLRQQLSSINGKSYPAYKTLKGTYDFGDYQLCIDHVQGDPFASPSHIKYAEFPRKLARLPGLLPGFPGNLYCASGLSSSEFLRSKLLPIASKQKVQAKAV